ncbi:hypothetical protein ABL840_05015 [Variovorax sp. NFACC27]|uniref:hypothetical protein n=1 Tax=unclassified Variovorax TaxID=663243 RepID=UPI00089BB63D|nr:hypothetical protein SAMN03159371_00136 [Variovorax sp. NFACC28]SEF71867.1 hypothetical protein SAMN03159365_00682 [Variovorax sp. NFACC29]SFB76992.1 hypothetical protein SAMN03159379_00681 [Variovorax sp. NFACC26]SFG76616.1 hypothetical protein SAMN03159447_04804 [Variovorax sp. NFACC27]
MTLDTPDAGPSEGLSVNQASEALSSLLDDDQPAQTGDRVELKQEPATNTAAAGAEDTASATAGEAGDGGDAGDDGQAQPEMFTVKIDGKEIQVPREEVIAGYQRQQDATRKTMAAAETRKAADTEIAQARAERQQYAENLTRFQHQLEAVLQQQQEIDWPALIERDPQEAMRQQHLLSQRQAALQQTYQQQHQIQQQVAAEQFQQFQDHLRNQHDILVAKLPEWKDEGTRKAEMTAIRDYLTTNGYTAAEIQNVADHRAILNVRKAMLYDQLMSKADAAAKKVANTPTKVVRSGTGDSGSTDKRTAAYQNLARTGSVKAGAAVIESLLD